MAEAQPTPWWSGLGGCCFAIAMALLDRPFCRRIRVDRIVDSPTVLGPGGGVGRTASLAVGVRRVVICGRDGVSRGVVGHWRKGRGPRTRGPRYGSRHKVMQEIQRWINDAADRLGINLEAQSKIVSQEIVNSALATFVENTPRVWWLSLKLPSEQFSSETMRLSEVLPSQDGECWLVIESDHDVFFVCKAK